MEERWNREEFNKAKGVPWKPDPNSEGIEIKTNVRIPRKTEEVVKAFYAPMIKEHKEGKYAPTYFQNM